MAQIEVLQDIKDLQVNKADKATTDDLAQQINVLNGKIDSNIIWGTLLNGWTAAWHLDFYKPRVTVTGNEVCVNAVLTAGVATDGTVLCELLAPIERVIIQVAEYDTKANGFLLLDVNGQLQTLGNITASGVYAINFVYRKA